MIPSATRQDAIVVACKMEELGLGRFISGRRGSPTRLVWLFRSDNVGKVASDELKELVPLTADSETVVNSGRITHHFYLRPEETVQFELPRGGGGLDPRGLPKGDGAYCHRPACRHGYHAV